MLVNVLAQSKIQVGNFKDFLARIWKDLPLRVTISENYSAIDYFCHTGNCVIL